MKTILRALLLSFALTPALPALEYPDSELHPVGYSEDAAGTTSSGAAQGGRDRQFSLYGSCDIVGSSDFSDHHHEGQSIRYKTALMGITSIVGYHSAYEEGLAVGLQYSHEELRWHNNPFFSEQSFHMASLTLNAFSKRLANWSWRAALAMNFDTDHGPLFSYATYDLLLWGRYQACDALGFHIGFVGNTGLRIDRVYPLLGVDWLLNHRWKLNMIFPTELSLVYSISPCWAMKVAGRSFHTRHRVGGQQCTRRGLFEYTNGGVELALAYEIEGCFTADLHAGSTTGGKINVSDRRRHNKHHYRFKPAPYAGCSFSFRF